MGTNNPESVISVMMILWHFWRNHEGIADHVVMNHSQFRAANGETSLFPEHFFWPNIMFFHYIW